MTGDKIVDGCAWYPGTGADTSACEVGSVVSLGKTERKTWALFALHWDWGDCATWAAMLPASVPVSPRLRVWVDGQVGGLAPSRGQPSWLEWSSSRPPGRQRAGPCSPRDDLGAPSSRQ